MSKLPNGWRAVALADLAGPKGLLSDGDWIESKDQDPTGTIRLTQLADIGDGKFLNKSTRYVNAKTAARLRCTFLEEGDLLIARMPDPLGRACIFPGVEQPAITAVDVFIWRTDGSRAAARWVMYAINGPHMREKIRSEAGGTTRQRVAGGKLKRITLPTPPLHEQRRIVAKLDSVTGHTARARGELERIPRLVEKYREAILAAEFDDGHTSAWESGIFEKRVAEGLIGLVRAKSQQDHTVGTPYIRMNHYDLDGRWNFDSLTCVATTPAEGDRFSLQPDDVLFNTRNSVELVGKVAIWKGEPNKFVYNNNLLRLRFRRGVVPAFAALYMMSPQFRRFLETVKSATTSVAAIYQRSLYSAPFPIPSVAAQRQIVSRIETAFAWLDRVVAEHANASRLLPKLDQAILAKAFRGELVLSDGQPRPVADAERA